MYYYIRILEIFEEFRPKKKEERIRLEPKKRKGKRFVFRGYMH